MMLGALARRLGPPLPSARAWSARELSLVRSAAAVASECGVRRCSGVDSARKRRRAARVALMTETVAKGPQLADFVRDSGATIAGAGGGEEQAPAVAMTALVGSHGGVEGVMAQGAAARGDVRRRSFYVETYGCQMNVSDSEIVHAIMEGGGFDRVGDVDEADVILVNTCAIRENAESKVWQRLNFFKGVKKARSTKRARREGRRRPVVGVLGCMAERLKTRLLESDKLVDIVVGPDAYRDLPELVRTVSPDAVPDAAPLQAANVQLSVDETYADITPVRETDGSRVSAFLSIMRGCNNMCSFCVVPFTRGRERSRPVSSVEDEIRVLADQGFREVVLLGQNVNSYHDRSEEANGGSGDYETAKGFSNMYRLRQGSGLRFADLLDRVSSIDPEMRVRFTSPHPKDFPDALLQLMAERPNICNSVHLPAQSGNTEVLERMRRGYTREAFLELAQHIRDTIPGVALSTDIIAGFCGETEEQHADTVSLMDQVGFEQAFMFAYSMRERTNAYYRMEDNVPEDVKLRRLQEIIKTFRMRATERNLLEVGNRQLMLVEGTSKRSTEEKPELVGRTDNNKRIVIPNIRVSPSMAAKPSGADVVLQAGDYAWVEVVSAGTTTLQALPLARTTIAEHARSSTA